MRPPDTRGLSVPAVADVWHSRESRIDGTVPTIAAYVIRAPRAHPFWDWHVMCVVHLRYHPDFGQANHIAFPGATHEVLVTALDPTHDAGIDPDNGTTWKHMQPHDMVHQVIVNSDAEAARLAELCAKAVADGHLVPDSDHRAFWELMLDNTAEHLRLGGHPS